jgi:hypothetical protein
MIYDGLGYFVVLTVANTINAVLYRSQNSILQVAGAPLSGLVTWIMSQRILIHLQDASEKQMHTEMPPHVHRSTRSSSTKDTSVGDHCDHVEQQEGTELVGVRVDRSVVVDVGPWNAEPSDEPDSDEPCRKPAVRWGQGLV